MCELCQIFFYNLHCVGLRRRVKLILHNSSNLSFESLVSLVCYERSTDLQARPAASEGASIVASQIIGKADPIDHTASGNGQPRRPVRPRAVRVGRRAADRCVVGGQWDYRRLQRVI